MGKETVNFAICGSRQLASGKFRFKTIVIIYQNRSRIFLFSPGL